MYFFIHLFRLDYLMQVLYNMRIKTNIMYQAETDYWNVNFTMFSFLKWTEQPHQILQTTLNKLLILLQTFDKILRKIALFWIFCHLWLSFFVILILFLFLFFLILPFYLKSFL